MEEKKYSGYGYHGGGRKALPDEVRKSKRIALRLTEEEYQKIKAKADAEGKTLSAYILDLLLK